MIFVERTITIKKNQAKIKEPIVLYKGDMNIELQFTIENNPFKYKPGMDVTYGQLIIKRPNAEPIFSEPAKMSSSRVLFIVTGDMIDGLDVDGNYTDEMGAYDFQIQLLNADQTSRGSLPPVTGGIIIKEPLCEPAAASRAAVNSRSTFVMRANNDNDELFDIDGNYMRTTWVSGDIITDAKLNRVEEALYQINDSVPTDYSTIMYVDTSIADLENQIDATITMESREIKKYVEDHYAPRSYVDNNYALKNYVNSTIANHDIANRNYTDNAINNAGFATELYVDQQINNIEIPESDLSDYAKVEYVDAAIANVELMPGPQGEPGPQGPQGPAGKDADPADLTGYATEEYVNNVLGNIESLLGGI